MRLRLYRSADQVAAIALWHRREPVRLQNDAQREIAIRLTKQRGGSSVAKQDRAIVGGVMIGYDGHRG